MGTLIDFSFSHSPHDLMSGCQQLNLGSYSWQGVSSRCQRSFDQGLVQYWGYHHEDAKAHFLDCLASDPHNVLAMVFRAFCEAPNYNNPMGLDIAGGRQALQQAQALQSSCPFGSALLPAALARFGDGSLAENNANYAEQMKSIALNFPDVADIQCLYIESLMCKRPWSLWPTLPEYNDAIKNNQPIPQPTDETKLIETLLEASFLRWKTHPGLLHLIIHFWELSPTPEKGLQAAELLYGLCPDQGHLQHMPSHIHMWVGMYDQAVQSNIIAVQADDKYVSLSGQETNFWLYYRVHNIHFVVWAAMVSAKQAIAFQYAKRLEMDVLRFVNKDNAKFLESFGHLVWMVRIRFGKWNEIVSQPLSDNPLMCTYNAVGLYAKALASAALGEVQKAEEFENQCLELISNTPDLHGYDNRNLHNNAVYDPQGSCGLLNIAKEMMRGEILYRKGKFDESFSHLRQAVQFDDELKYDEPWMWLVPARHALGALLTEQGKYDEAVSVFREDLAKMPANPWGLKGLFDCLTLKGDPKDRAEASLVNRELAVRMKDSDFDLVAPCACARVAGAAAPSSCCKSK